MNYKMIMLLAAVCAGSSLFAQQRTQFRNTQDAVRYYEDLVGTLSRQVKSMQDENAMLAESVSTLKRKFAKIEADNKALQQGFEELRKQVAADAEVRKNQMNSLADKLSQPPQTQTKNSAVKSVPSKRRQGKNVKETVSNEQEFIEHKVEPGTTLTALAKAYKVSVRDIINANKLKNGKIYAGQKLLIPVADPKK